ncbi:N-acyl homoserine lactonase family protein [Planktotalea sp.]|uniref:N-acyl homoserine lactonase family protein n=1 Tax=Planktotalea sp. TaxID=2029877 RepID=UPI003D6C684C
MNLDGYIKGSPTQLFILDYGLFQVHSDKRIIGICGFLIRTSAGENILIDTGFHRRYQRDAQAASEEDGLLTFGELLTLEPQNFPHEQLALCGIDTSEIDLLIITHTHIDHVGGIADFPDCPILMSQHERALPQPIYWADTQSLEWPDRDYFLIKQDTLLAPSFCILHVPGHTPGQLAFLLTLPDTGPILLTSDAISRPCEVDQGFAGSWDESAALKSANRLLDLAGKDDAFIIYGHCPKQWSSLRKAPRSYR